MEAVNGSVLRWPAFEGGHREQGHHGHEDVVKVKVAVVPHPPLHSWLVYISILVDDVGPSVREGEQK